MKEEEEKVESEEEDKDEDETVKGGDAAATCYHLV